MNRTACLLLCWALVIGGCGGGSGGSGADRPALDAAADRPAADGAAPAPDGGGVVDGPGQSPDLRGEDGGNQDAPGAADAADAGTPVDGPELPPAQACQPATPPGAKVASAPWRFAGHLDSDWVLITDGTKVAVAPRSGAAAPTVISDKATAADGEDPEVSHHGTGVYVVVDNPTLDDEGRAVGTLKLWSPGTGVQVLATRARVWGGQSNLLLFTDLGGATPEVKLVALPAGTPRSLGEEIDEAVFSPDARHLVLARGEHIWVVDSNGGAPVDVDVGSDPLPAGDGMGLYFMRIGAGDSGDLYHRPLSLDPAPAAVLVAPDVLPSDRQVVRGSPGIVWRRASGAIARVATPGAAEQVLVPSGARLLYPVLPDGSGVFYSTTAPADPPPPLDLQLVPLAGGPARKIASASLAYNFTWSSDGRYVIYQDPGDPDSNLGKVQVLDLADSGSTPATVDPQGDFLAAPWDTRHFLVLGSYDQERETGRLFSYDAATGTATPVHGSVGRSGFQADGNRIAYTVAGCGAADGLYVTELPAAARARSPGHGLP